MGRAMVAGGKPAMEAPVALTGIKGSDLAVGSSVYLMENGSAVEYLVVHSGLPSSLYDSSCDGLWLLRKDVFDLRAWNSSSKNIYASSTLHSYLNSTFLALLGSVEQAAIKQAKIPYVNGDGIDGAVASGANGLSVKVFSLSAQEVGASTGYYDDPTPAVDGAKLDYFQSGNSYGNTNMANRIAYYDGTATSWWTRSPMMDNSSCALYVSGGNGAVGCYDATSTDAGGDPFGSRPALILPSNAVFDEDTLVLKGVA